MAKAPAPKSGKSEPQKLLMFNREDGAYGLTEIEIDKAVLLEHGKITDKTNPDIFAIFLTNLTKKARELFEI